MTTVRLTLLREERDVQQVEALEAASFPAVEAANEKTIRLRQHEAGQFFSVAHTAEGVLVGFVTSTLTTAEGSVDTHDPDGSTLCIRSVVVDPASRRQGIALRMLKQYVETTCHQQQVDAFTREPFQGNPAAVVLLQPGGFHHERAPEWMQLVAREKNLGATAFAAPREASADVTVVEYDIKWFSPLVELTLCGHGTLSTATVRFYNRTNILICRYEVTSDQQFRVVMNFPCKLTAPLSPGTSLEAIAAALGVAPVGVLDARLALNDVIVRLDKSAFESLTPDHGRINEIETGFVVTTEAPSNHSADFLSRFFAPSIGINEDPVTGSAHCGLGPYWSGILGKRKLTGYQATSVRGGFVEIDLDDAQPGRVLLKCQGVVVACGVLTPSH
uniref:N-acetyltransferase domain-containing protein n=1 Tax=Phytophthora ramorum TaxID=164328 RepID=H3H1G3_PHYRM